MEKQRSYEGLFVMNAEKDESAVEVQNSIKAVIAENNGTVVEEKMMGKKSLAYPVKKKTEAVYYGLVFNILPSAIEKLTRQFRINTDILRAMIDRAGSLKK